MASASGGAGGGAGAGAGAGRSRQRSRGQSPASSSRHADPGPQGGAGACAGVGSSGAGRSALVKVHWGAATHAVPVWPGQTVADVAEAVRKRRPGALRRPRLFLASDAAALWPDDLALAVMRDDAHVEAVWDRSLREVLASSPAMLMVAECLCSWAELCALGATCSDALRAVRGLELDWDVTAFDEDEVFEPNARDARDCALAKLFVTEAQVAAWRVSFPRARCCMLWVNESPLTEAARSSLRGLRRLELYTPNPTRITDDDFKELGGVVDLTAPGLSSDGGAGSPALAMGRLTSLRRLKLLQEYGDEDHINPALYKALAKTQLEMLEAGCVFIRDEDVQWLPVTLRRLEIGGWHSRERGALLSDEGCASLTRLMRLTWLNVRASRVTDVGVSHIAQLTSLTRLELNVSFTDAGLGHVGGMVGLRDLVLDVSRSGDAMTDAGMAQLGKLKALRRLRLDVRRTAVTPTALASLATCTQLHHLALLGKAPFNGDRRVLRAVDVASLACLKRVTVVSSEALSKEEEAELAARGVEVEHVADWADI